MSSPLEKYSIFRTLNSRLSQGENLYQVWADTVLLNVQLFHDLPISLNYPYLQQFGYAPF